MTPEKTATAKPDTKPDTKPEVKAKYTVGNTPIYIGADRHDPGATVELTASQAKRLDALVTAA